MGAVAGVSGVAVLSAIAPVPVREGVHNFFATFIEVLKDRQGATFEVEPGVTSGDYLLGFLLGTRRALYEKGRESIASLRWNSNIDPWNWFVPDLVTTFTWLAARPNSAE